MDIGVESSFRQLLKPIETFTCKILSEHTCFYFFGQMPRKGIMLMACYNECMFNCIRNCQTVFSLPSKVVIPFFSFPLSIMKVAGAASLPALSIYQFVFPF